LNSIALAKERVKSRVQEGGHHIPDDIVERRYLRGIKNLFDIYLDLVDGTMIFDNSYGQHELIAQKTGQENILVFNQEKYDLIKRP